MLVAIPAATVACNCTTLFRLHLYILPAARFAPADKVSYSRNGERQSQARIKSRKELDRHTGNVFQTDAQPHHENDDQVAVKVEKGEKRFPALREVQYASGVPLDEVVEHQRESDGNGDSNRNQPPNTRRMTRSYRGKGFHPSDEDFYAGTKPEQYLHQQQMFAFYGEYFISASTGKWAHKKFS